MQLKSLEIFLAVVEHGSFSMAAQHLYTVQSNITNHIKKLEQELDCELLSRQNPILVTSAGQDLLHYASKILALHQQCKAHFLDHEINQDIPIKIGSMETAATMRLPELFHFIFQKYPDIQLNLQTAPTRDLIDFVQQSKIDCAFVAHTDPIPNLYCLHVWTEKLLLVCSQKLALKLDRNDLQKVKFIGFKQGCSYRHIIELFLQDYQLPASQILEMNSLDGMLNCVLLGMGCAILPEKFVLNSQYFHQLKCFELSDHLAISNTYFIANDPNTWSKNLAFLFPLIKEFSLENLKKQATH